MSEKMAKIAKYYTAYLCGAFDVFTELSDAHYAADIKKVIERTIADIAREAYLLGQEEKK